MFPLTPKENTALDVAVTRLGQLVDRMERAAHPYPRERTWPDCEDELEKMTANTLTKDQSLELMQAEIERLRLAAENDLQRLLWHDKLLLEKDTEIERLRDAAVIARTTEANLHEEIKRLRGLLQWWLDAGPHADWDDYERRVYDTIRNAR